MNQRDISFANFNLLNLNLPGKPIYSDTGGWSQEQYKIKIAWIGAMLINIDADVIGFQECWSVEALVECFTAAGLIDEYDIVARNLEPNPGIQVALAIKKGMLLGEPEWLDDFPENVRFEGLREKYGAQEEINISISKFGRSPLKVRIQPTGTNPEPAPITVYVVHLKSKGPARLDFAAPQAPILSAHASTAQNVVSHVRRVLEAGALRAQLDNEMIGNEDALVVLGDLNGATTSTTTELITGNPGYRFFEKSRAGSRSDQGLYTVEKLQQLRSFRHVYYTYIHKQKMESLDHIMVSDRFYDHADNRLWSYRDMVIYNDHLALPKDKLKSIGASDHAVVKAYFDWNPMDKIITAT